MTNELHYLYVLCPINYEVKYMHYYDYVAVIKKDLIAITKPIELNIKYSIVIFSGNMNDYQQQQPCCRLRSSQDTHTKAGK